MFSYINLSRAVYPAIRKAGGGVMSSMFWALLARRPTWGYIAGKCRLASLMARSPRYGRGTSLGDRSIRVVACNPGPIRPSVWRDDAARNRGKPSFSGDPTRWQELVPYRTLVGTPEHAPTSSLSLASDRASHITGTVVTIDGGRRTTPGHVRRCRTDSLAAGVREPISHAAGAPLPFSTTRRRWMSIAACDLQWEEIALNARTPTPRIGHSATMS